MKRKIIAPEEVAPLANEPADMKAGMKRYEVICKACKKIMGYCWATDNTLRDWCAFYYVQRNDGKRWHGCMTPHVSPVTEQLCLECCCGQDTRDFRANTTLSAKVAIRVEKRNRAGREFGRPDSKFLTRLVKRDTMVLKEEK